MSARCLKFLAASYNGRRLPGFHLAICHKSKHLHPIFLNSSVYKKRTFQLFSEMRLQKDDPKRSGIGSANTQLTFLGFSLFAYPFTFLILRKNLYKRVKN
jgi:hypothetical protein